MIQQKHIAPYPNPEIIRGKAITVPNKSVDPTEMLKRMTVGSIENRAALYYEKQGFPIPDFHMMDHIEKLEALAEFRKEVAKNRKKLQEINDSNKRVVDDAKLKSHIKNEVDAEIKKRAGHSTPGQSGNAGQANPHKES